MDQKITDALKQTSLWIFLALLAYMPLHIFLSTWLGTSFGILEFVKVAKDGVLVVGFVLVLLASIQKAWFKEFLRDKLLWLILAYSALTVFMALVKPTDQDAEILGVVYNTRFLLFFIYGGLLARLYPGYRVRRMALKAVLAAGAVVVVFGVVQYLFLPNTALSHVGYVRSNGVLPAFFIDEKPDLERIMSTLRDPNSLGSYLIIIATIIPVIWLATKRQRTKQLMAVYLALTIASLWFTFSRSAQLGFVLATGVFVMLIGGKVKNVFMQHKKPVAITAAVVLVVATAGLYVARNTYLVQNVLFHADNSTVMEDPNQLRKRFWQESVLRINLQPEGGGPGTAGLASIRNEKQGVILTENYYLQVGEEVGVLGLALFMAILAGVTIRLYRVRDSKLAVALLASFIGLAFTNLLVHIWSNEAVAYTWWGLAGLVLVKQRVNVRAVNKGKNK
jgi:putative inorganic carbon (hco3(-)) transporter